MVVFSVKVVETSLQKKAAFPPARHIDDMWLKFEMFVKFQIAGNLHISSSFPDTV